MYKTTCIWAEAVGEVLISRREPTNSADRYAVVVLKEETIIGHLSRKMSKVCTLFLRRGGSICCKVTGSRCYSRDLPQGGLDIHVPCSLLFIANMRKVLAAKCTNLDQLNFFHTFKSVSDNMIYSTEVLQYAMQ